jgi:hypothetical protein
VLNVLGVEHFSGDRDNGFARDERTRRKSFLVIALDQFANLLAEKLGLGFFYGGTGCRAV